MADRRPDKERAELKKKKSIPGRLREMFRIGNRQDQGGSSKISPDMLDETASAMDEKARKQQEEAMRPYTSSAPNLHQPKSCQNLRGFGTSPHAVRARKVGETGFNVLRSKHSEPNLRSRHPPGSTPPLPPLPLPPSISPRHRRSPAIPNVPKIPSDPNLRNLTSADAKPRVMREDLDPPFNSKKGSDGTTWF